MALSQSAFIHALQEAFGYRQGKVLRVSELASYPLALTKAQQVASHRTVVVGNAAQALHPIAGQGFNLGLRDLSALVSILKNSAEKHAQQQGLNQLIVLTTQSTHWFLERGFVKTEQSALPATRRHNYNTDRNSQILCKPLHSSPQRTGERLK